jgi:hypothetical protein
MHSEWRVSNLGVDIYSSHSKKLGIKQSISARKWDSLESIINRIVCSIASVVALNQPGTLIAAMIFGW